MVMSYSKIRVQRRNPYWLEWVRMRLELILG